MPVATSILLAGAALAVGVGSAAAGTIQARAAAKDAKKAAKAQKQAVLDAGAKKPAADTGANIRLLSRDKSRKRGRGSLAARNRAAALGGLEGASASAVGGL